MLQPVQPSDTYTHNNNVGFEMSFLCVALAALEITVETRLAWNSQRAACLYLTSAGRKREKTVVESKENNII